jgi:hypothetical protein
VPKRRIGTPAPSGTHRLVCAAVASPHLRRDRRGLRNPPDRPVLFLNHGHLSARLAADGQRSGRRSARPCVFRRPG